MGALNSGFSSEALGSTNRCIFSTTEIQNEPETLAKQYQPLGFEVPPG
jgi:hypothetical protein